MDDLALVIKLVSLGILLILNALFSAAEALLARLTRDDILKFAEEGGKRYELLTSPIAQPTSLLVDHYHRQNDSDSGERYGIYDILEIPRGKCSPCSRLFRCLYRVVPQKLCAG